MHNDMQPDISPVPSGEVDREGAMAKADLYKLANYSLKLFKKVQDDDQLEAWVQAKITKAADYIASVYHYMEYEMKFSEYGEHLANAEVYSEGQKAAITNKLMEAKEKVAELKKLQAKKKQMEEGILGGGDRPCTECGGTGMVYEEPKQVPSHVKAKVAAYNKKAIAMNAATKRVDKNKNGIPDDLEDKDVEEGFEAGAKTGSTFKTKTGVATKTDKGLTHTNTSHSDEEHGEPPSKVKAKSAAEKKADKDKEVKLPKHSGNTWGMKNGEKFGKKMEEAKKLKGDQKKLDADNDGDIEADDLAALRAKNKKVDETKKPSAGLTKAQKSATVKSAKKGEDIGKPGKNFDKVAKAAGGGEKGERIAAAAMWKNKAKAVKESLEQMGAVSEADLDEAITPDQNLDALIKYAAQVNPQGLQAAQQKGPDAVMALLQSIMQQGGAQQAAPAPQVAAAPQGQPFTPPEGAAPQDPNQEFDMKESNDMTRMREQLGRLNQNESFIVKESSEVDQLRALTKMLKG